MFILVHVGLVDAEPERAMQTLRRQELKKELWLRIREYHFDNLVPPHLMDHVVATFGRTDASSRAFAGKIARKLGWPHGFALLAIAEYKKFVYLGVTADFHVTPSKTIDQVWHEHLLFSKAYREFCRDVLERDFDHHPELVPTNAQTSVFSGQYEGTLRLYVAEFNMVPPVAIWGTPKFPIELKRKSRKLDHATTSGSDAPLYTSFDGRDGGPSSHEMAEFGGGGGFLGGGGSDSWGDLSSDGGSGDGSGSGSDGGGSGCSSSCGGGGCGGGD